MRLILVIVCLVQLQGCVKATHGGEFIPHKYNLPPGMYELRRITDDEIGSIKPDRIVTIPENEDLMKSLEAWQRQQGNPQSGRESVPVTGGTRRFPQDTQQRTHSDKQVSVTDNEVSRREYIQSQILKGYLPQQMLQDTTKHHKNPEPHAKDHYKQQQVKSEQRPHEMTRNHQNYMQQSPQNYQIVDEDPKLGGISISLPGYDDGSDNYQVVNEGPVAHVVSVPASGNPTNSLYPPQWSQKMLANRNPQQDYYHPNPVTGQHNPQIQNAAYKPFESSYIPQQPEVHYDRRKPQQQDNPQKVKTSSTDQILEMIRNGQMLPPGWQV